MRHGIHEFARLLSCLVLCTPRERQHHRREPALQEKKDNKDPGYPPGRRLASKVRRAKKDQSTPEPPTDVGPKHMLLRQRCSRVEPPHSKWWLFQHLLAERIKLQSDQEIDKRAFKNRRSVWQREVARRRVFDVAAIHVREFLLPDAELRLVIMLPEVPVELALGVLREVELRILGQRILKRVYDVDPGVGESG